MFPDIQSTQNQRIKDAVKLRQRSGRDKQSQFVIDGLREIQQALEGGADLVSAFVCDELSQSGFQQQTIARLKAAGVPLSTVSKSVWEKLTFGDRDDGVLAIGRVHKTDWAAIPQVACPLIVVLESIEKPGNIGAVLRTADAAGITAVILAEPSTDVFNPNTIRASLGAVFRVPIVTGSNSEVADWFAQSAIQPFVARLDGSIDYASVDLTAPTALVLGNEAVGVSSFWRTDNFQAIRLPMLGQVDSLNVSNAAAILMYESIRQRSN